MPGSGSAPRRHEPKLSHPLEMMVDMDSIIIDCGTCSARATAACADCVVTYLCEREPDDALVIDVAEFRALRMLNEAGLVPKLRHIAGA